MTTHNHHHPNIEVNSTKSSIMEQPHQMSSPNNDIYKPTLDLSNASIFNSKRNSSVPLNSEYFMRFSDSRTGSPSTNFTSSQNLSQNNQSSLASSNTNQNAKYRKIGQVSEFNVLAQQVKQELESQEKQQQSGSQTNSNNNNNNNNSNNNNNNNLLNNEQQLDNQMIDSSKKNKRISIVNNIPFHQFPSSQNQLQAENTAQTYSYEEQVANQMHRKKSNFKSMDLINENENQIGNSPPIVFAKKPLTSHEQFVHFQPKLLNSSRKGSNSYLAGGNSSKSSQNKTCIDQFEIVEINKQIENSATSLAVIGGLTHQSRHSKMQKKYQNSFHHSPKSSSIMNIQVNAPSSSNSQLKISKHKKSASQTQMQDSPHQNKQQFSSQQAINQGKKSSQLLQQQQQQSSFQQIINQGKPSSHLFQFSSNKQIPSQSQQQLSLQDKFQIVVNKKLSHIIAMISNDIIFLRKYLKNDGKLYQVLCKLLETRHATVSAIIIKSNKKQEVFDSYSQIESNIINSLKMNDLQQKSSLMRLKQQFSLSLIYIPIEQLERELFILSDQLEQLKFLKTKQEVEEVFNQITTTQNIVQDKINEMNLLNIHVPKNVISNKPTFIKSKLNQLSERVSSQELRVGPFNRIDKEQLYLQSQIDLKLGQLQKDQHVSNHHLKY